jgi:hypothetical protein
MSECGLDLCTCSGNAWQCERAQCLCPDPSQVMTGVACPELMMTCTGIDDCALATSCVCAAADAGPRQWVCRSPSCAMDAGGD